MPSMNYIEYKIGVNYIHAKTPFVSLIWLKPSIKPYYYFVILTSRDQLNAYQSKRHQELYTA